MDPASTASPSAQAPVASAVGSSRTAGRRVEATFLALVGLVLLTGSVVLLTEMYNPRGPAEFPYLTRLIVTTRLIRFDRFATVSAMLGDLGHGVLIIIIATAFTWVQYWVLVLLTIWLPRGWRKVRWAVWLGHFVLAAIVVGGLLFQGAALYLVVIETSRSMGIQVMGMTTLARDRLGSSRGRLVEWSIYLGMPLVFALMALRAIYLYD